LAQREGERRGEGRFRRVTGSYIQLVLLGRGLEEVTLLEGGAR
jgi:hypothetical protein